jgi:NAD-dependent DNA ligase
MDEYIKELMWNLSMELLGASDAYHNGLPEVLEDASFDNKLNLLDCLEKRYPQYKFGGDGSELNGIVSPTEAVGANIVSSVEGVKHDKIQRSLDKKYTVNEIVEFIDGNYPVVGSLKADGLTIVSDYKQLLVDAVTRGNGIEGDRVLHTIRASNTPAAIPFKGRLKIRSEAVIAKEKFNQLVEKMATENVKKPKSARSLVAGTVRCLNSDVARERGVELHAFELLSIDDVCSYRIFQLPIEHKLCFRSFKEWEADGLYPKAEDYRMVYQGMASAMNMDNENNHIDFLNELYSDLNIKKPVDYKTRSLAISDVIVINYIEKGKNISVAYIVDGVGFKKILFDCAPAMNALTSDYFSRKFLESLGFSCIPYVLLNSDDEVKKYVDNVTKLREMDVLEYDIDGIVFSIDSIEKRNSLGYTAHHPLGSISYKFANKGKVSSVEEIKWQSGMFALTPVISIDPPLDFNGVTVTKATAHNLFFLLGKNEKGEIVRPPIKADGSTEVFIERSGEVIPKITEVYFNPDSVEFCSLDELYPKTCPECHEPTEISGVELKCTNPNCVGKLKAKLRNMVSRNCLDLQGFGEKTIDILVDKGFINSIQDVFSLQEYKNDLINLDGYGTKKVEKLLKEIKLASKAPLHNILASLCIQGVGPEVSRSLVPILTNGLIGLFTVNEEELMAIDGIGEVIARNIKEFTSVSKNNIISYLYNGLGVTPLKTEDKPASTLVGKTFVVTGTLFEDREAVESLIRINSGKVTSSVSSKTDYLVVGENPGKSKVAAADLFNVVKITGEQLLIMIQG